jgi:hypothetical protein
MSEASFPEMARALPSFDQWLDRHGDGTRGDGFAGLVDLARRTIEQERATTFHLDELAFLRLWKGLLIAVVELCNIEAQRDRKVIDTIKLMARALGCAAFYANCSALKEDTPWRSLAKILNEEFRAATKLCADQYTEHQAREAEAKQ